MPKQHYFFKLVPPRPTFPQDMSADERRWMTDHAAYFREHFGAGRVLLFGPVLAPGAPFGLGVLGVDDEVEARRFCEQDPSLRMGLNTFALHPMRVAASRAQEPEAAK
jgi:uncharacterized protein